MLVYSLLTYILDEKREAIPKKNNLLFLFLIVKFLFMLQEPDVNGDEEDDEENDGDDDEDISNIDGEYEEEQQHHTIQIGSQQFVPVPYDALHLNLFLFEILSVFIIF